MRDDSLGNAGLDHDLEDVEIGQKYVTAHRLLALYDNLHFQYDVGTLPESAWEPYRAQLRNELRKPIMKFVVRRNTEGTWRLGFLALCKELMEVKSALNFSDVTAKVTPSDYNSSGEPPMVFGSTGGTSLCVTISAPCQERNSDFALRIGF